MNTRIRARGTGHDHRLAKENSKGFFNLFLDGTCVGLYLEPTVGRAFIAYF